MEVTRITAQHHIDDFNTMVKLCNFRDWHNGNNLMSGLSPYHLIRFYLMGQRFDLANPPRVDNKIPKDLKGEFIHEGVKFTVLSSSEKKTLTRIKVHCPGCARVLSFGRGHQHRCYEIERMEATNAAA